MGWNQRDFPSLHGKLHLGDQLISVNGVKVTTVDVAQKLLKGATTPKITMVLHRMPYAKVFAIRRDAEGQSLGIKREGGSGEVRIKHDTLNDKSCPSDTNQLFYLIILHVYKNSRRIRYTLYISKHKIIVLLVVSV